MGRRDGAIDERMAGQGPAGTRQRGGVRRFPLEMSGGAAGPLRQAGGKSFAPVGAGARSRIGREETRDDRKATSNGARVRHAGDGLPVAGHEIARLAAAADQELGRRTGAAGAIHRTAPCRRLGIGGQPSHACRNPCSGLRDVPGLLRCRRPATAPARRSLMPCLPVTPELAQAMHPGLHSQHPAAPAPPPALPAGTGQPYDRGTRRLRGKES